MPRSNAGPAALLAFAFLGAGPAPEGGRQADQAALQPFAGLVGDWRGAGQPQRGSTRGAWTESARWAWALTPESAALEWKAEKGKYLASARLRPGREPKAFALAATLPDGSTRTYSGRAEADGRLVLTADAPAADGPSRITLTPRHDTRLLVLLEARDDAGTFRRIAEVGYTRQGVAFAAGDSYPVCIVTEGRGTIQVAHKGQTYWVCCSGCKELFEADPEAMLAEARERAKAKAR